MSEEPKVATRCADCSRPIIVPQQWATAPDRDRHRSASTRRRIVCHDPHGIDRSCYDPRRHVRWAGLDDDRWALVSNGGLLR